MNTFFPKRLKELRLAEDLNRSQLADLLDCSMTNIGVWERGLKEPKLSSLVKIAEYFDVSIDYLAGRADY